MNDAAPFDRARLQKKVLALAQASVFIGTSSWKYEGWRGMLYDEARYVFRGKVSENRFEKNCLTEYAEVFKTVSVDASYYKFPDRDSLAGMVGQVPPDFQFGFKVTGEITIKKFPNQPRHGSRAGQVNGNFLNAGLFESMFLQPCEAFRQNVGLLMFEFSHFYKTEFEHGRDFVAVLDEFLEKLPKGWPYGIEIRNKAFLHPDYFAVLAKHGVAHIYNSWGEMPSVEEQMAMPGSVTHPKLGGARFLLKPGRKYQEAVDMFKPYHRVQEPNPSARAAGAKLIKDGVAAGKEKRRTFIYVNNRLEGNAPETIEEMVERVTAQEAAGTFSY